MIGRLRGQIASGKNGIALVNVAGVGYEVRMGEGDIARLNGDATTEAHEIFIDTVLREDSLKLYGFLSEPSRDLFRILCDVSGLGPKTALAVIDQLGSDNVVRAARSGDHRAFTSVSGIGDRTAQKIALELKSKIKKLQDWELNDKKADGSSGGGFGDSSDGQQMADLISAMVNLGYQKGRAETVVKEIWNDGADFDSRFRLAVGKLSGQKKS